MSSSITVLSILFWRSVYVRPLFLSFYILLILSIPVHSQSVSGQQQTKQISVEFEPVHQWRPPFGIERVGNSMEVVITTDSNSSKNKSLQLTSLRSGQELDKKRIILTGKQRFSAREIITLSADEIIVSEKTANGGWKELLRKKTVLPAFECEAIARPESIIHPVDMGAILVPADWLLLSAGQKGMIDFAAITRKPINSPLELKAWYASSPDRISSTKITLPINTTISKVIALPQGSSTLQHDELHISLVTAEGKETWQKTIKVMLMQKLTERPGFGAVKTKLRYDVPITNIVNGKNQPFSYDTAWTEDKEDYVVFLPNGSRWVFWRGASYIPIWVSKYNTGLSYEWAERISPNIGFTDCPEPLMDKKLKYGKVEIMESTAARVHVRWSYQSCDFNYKVNGDFAYEDYFFYPDGMGTRVLTLTSIPEAEYEVAEFILLAPAAALPFEVMPPKPMEIISCKTGKSFALTLPETDTTWKTLADPIIYKMKVHAKDPLSAFSFNPLLVKKPFAFQPFMDKGQIVTPAYWGGHWPLSQGFNTGRSINESIWSGPSHNSLVSWGPQRPEPIRSALLETHDALGVPKTMKEETWVWLIGMTDASNDTLLHTAKSFAQPPSLIVQGARQEPDGYSSERRALRLIAEGKKISVTIQPQGWCVNPVFEIRNAAASIKELKWNGVSLKEDNYAWDGKTLWIRSHFQEKKNLEIVFN